MRALRTVLLAIALLLAGVAPGRTTEIPFLGGRVNDTAGLLSNKTTAALEDMLKVQEDSTSNQVVVLTVTSLEGEEIENFSMRVVETWKLGQKGKDNGVLLLVSKDDRQVRIEVGRGLEGDLTDLTCGRIIRHEIVPRFKEGDYDGGVRVGVESILAAIQGAYTADAEEDDSGMGFVFPGLALIPFIFFLAIISPFTFIALFSRGFASWFLYFFLIPFWSMFPISILGMLPGLVLFAAYVIGFPILKFVFAKTPKGKAWAQKWGKAVASAQGGSGGGRSGGGSSSGGGGSSFSGGGGSFSGGGSSGSW